MPKTYEYAIASDGDMYLKTDTSNEVEFQEVERGCTTTPIYTLPARIIPEDMPYLQWWGMIALGCHINVEKLPFLKFYYVDGINIYTF